MGAPPYSKVNDRIVFRRIAKELDASASMAAHLQSVIGKPMERLVELGEVLPAEIQELDHLTQVLAAIADYMREVCEQLPGTELDVSQALMAVPIRKLARRLSECHPELAREVEHNGSIELF